jgi:site-specific DNA-methyltransferase (adenine-specific)
MLMQGDCKKLLATLPDNSVDSIVTDPPYELGFMGKSWDNSGIAYSVELWSQALRVLKPGGHLLAFGGSRTYHRLASAVEDAGFEIRDQIMWLYGSGFPKSHNLKDEWQGWGTALKPAHEPIVVARKPLIGTVATNVLTYGTGALNIDDSRVGTGTGETKTVQYPDIRGNNYNNAEGTVEYTVTDQGRWPANVIHDGSDEVLEYFGEPQRFFYCAKASKSERNAGLEGLPEKGKVFNGQNAEPSGNAEGSVEDKFSTKPSQNFHPTVKPIALMRYLVKLVTPPNGTVLDPFLGSGTTAVAAILEGFNWMGCEMTKDYWPIIEARVAWAEKQAVAVFYYNRNGGLYPEWTDGC